jgi:nicotinamidase/pyrazinamidase
LNSETVTVSPQPVLWGVDVQVDFMLPRGNLYVSGAEKIIANIKLLADAARQGRVLLISSADAHSPDDAELRDWPPHCLKGSSGAELLPEACASPRLLIPNRKGFALPQDLGTYRQVTFEKNTLDVFDNPNTDAFLARINPAGSPALASDPQFVVFGVATEYCVRHTAEGLLRRGHSIAIATDAVRAINQEKGKQVLHDLCSRGARLIATEGAVALVSPPRCSL